MKQQHQDSEVTIGLDLGERRHRFCALDRRGEVVEEGSLLNDRVSLARLTARYPGALAVMEAGTHSQGDAVPNYDELEMDCPTLGNGIMDARFQSSSPIMHRFVSEVRTDPISHFFFLGWKPSFYLTARKGLEPVYQPLRGLMPSLVYGLPLQVCC
jgi:hypothetical protein